MSKFEIGVPLMDEPEAKATAKAKAKNLKRETITASCTVIGDPNIRAGAPMSFSGVRPGVDGLQFIIESATHSFSKSGYTTDIEAKLKV
jgi:hypothetical protein